MSAAITASSSRVCRLRAARLWVGMVFADPAERRKIAGGSRSRSLAWNQERRFTFPDRALRRGAVQCPFSEACWISELREYGYARPRNAFLRAHPSVSVGKGARFLSTRPRWRRLPFPGGWPREEIERLFAAHHLINIAGDPFLDLVAAEERRMEKEGLERRIRRRRHGGQCAPRTSLRIPCSPCFSVEQLVYL